MFMQPLGQPFLLASVKFIYDNTKSININMYNIKTKIMHHSIGCNEDH